MDYTDEQLAQIAGVKLHPMENAPSSNFDHVSDEQLAKIAGVNLKDTQPKATIKDRASQVGTGLFKGAVTGTAGMLGDTVANIHDIGNSISGYVNHKFLGLPASAMPEIIPDRSKFSILGIPIPTSERLNQSVRDAGGSALVDPTGTMDETGRLLHAGAMGLGGGLSGHAATGATGGLAGLAKAGAYGAGTAAASQRVGDATGSPTLAALANAVPMAHGLASSAIGNKVKIAIRGSDAEGLPQLHRTLADYQAGGIDQPTVGMATGNRVIVGLENGLMNAPGSVGVANQARDGIIGGLKNKVNDIRDSTSLRYGQDVAGKMLQDDIKSGVANIRKNGYAPLNDRADAMIPQENNGSTIQYPIVNTRRTLANLVSIDPDSPNYSAGEIHPDISDMNRRVLADLGSSGGQFPTGRYTSGIIPTQIMEHGPSYQGIRSMRSDIGERLGESSLLGNRQKAPYRQLYGALADDRMAAAQATDMQQGPQPSNKGPAMRAAKRADNYYTALDKRSGAVQPIADAQTPEAAHRAYIDSGNNDGSITTLRAVKRTVTPETRASNTATWIDELGRASPRDQNNLSDVFSPEKFLENWNQKTPKARGELLSGLKAKNILEKDAKPDTISQDLNAVAKAISKTQESGSKIFKDSSDPTSSISLPNAKGASLTSLLFSGLKAAGGVGGSWGVNARISKKLMADPGFLNWLAEPTRNSSVTASSHLQKLAVIVNQSKDPEFKKSAKEYMDAVSASQNSQ